MDRENRNVVTKKTLCGLATSKNLKWLGYRMKTGCLLLSKKSENAETNINERRGDHSLIKKSTISKPSANKLKGRFKERWEDWFIRKVEEK